MYAYTYTYLYMLDIRFKTSKDPSRELLHTILVSL